MLKSLSMKKFFLLSLLICAFLSSFSQNSFMSDSLDVYIKREMKKWEVPGLAVTVVKDGKVIVAKGYGTREAGAPGEAVDENTLFQIASNSKAFTATSIALLAYQHRLNLDDKVTKWMKDFKLKDPLATEDIRIRDLLCHRLGFETFQGDFLNWGCNLSRKEIITNLRNIDPIYSFRSRYGYCNAGFLTAGELIPIVTDTTWDDFLKAHFFKPLNMTRTSTTWSAINTDKNACKPYTIAEGKLVLLPYVNVDNLGPAASINSSVHDLSHWLLMQLDSGRYEGKHVVPDAVLENTRASNTVVHDQNNRYFPSKHFQTYGLGWFLEDYEGKKIISHDGGADGFVTTNCIIPELHLGISVLTNTDMNYLYAALRQQIIDAYLGLPYRNYSDYYFNGMKRSNDRDEEELKKEEAVVALKNKPELELSRYCGKFHNAVYGDITIKEEKGQLNIYFSHHPQLIGHLQPLEKNTFLCRYSSAEYGIKQIPFTVADNKVVAVSVSVNSAIDYLSYEFTRTD
jgi:CubicO group peptidase (beta-lactamase class C family)